MNQVTPETTIGELCSYEEYKPLSDYFFTNMTEDVWRRPLGDYGFKKCGFEETLERIKALVLTGQPLIYPSTSTDLFFDAAEEAKRNGQEVDGCSIAALRSLACLRLLEGESPVTERYTRLKCVTLEKPTILLISVTLLSVSTNSLWACPTRRLLIY